MMEIYKYLVIGISFGLVGLSAIYLSVTLATNFYMTVFHKSFWKGFDRKSGKRLMVPRFFTKVEDFYKLKAYRRLERSPFFTFAVCYGPVHAFLSDKLFPLLAIAGIVAVIIVPGVLSLIGVF